ncbi:monoacylglycerol lipase ABHD2 [Schistocerca gregaria]|uniref:monoacylglycerol lipase ABHD2 n=1 Tax=Schistocerca gregaria TaxID=7010 RepID=UPI00211E4177|nr:monoacylglycerol lipase ABHD2 [Schistocerca gregaria]
MFFLTLLAFAVLCAVLMITFKVYFREEEVKIMCSDTKFNKFILENCPSLKIYDRIPIWGLNGHLQTCYASAIRKGPTHLWKRECLENSDGEDFWIDWLNSKPRTNAIICVIPGIAGHSGNDYIKNFAHFCQLEGYQVVCWNWPGCGDHVLSHARMTTLGDAKHLKVMFDHVFKKYPDVPIYAVGFSLGANMLLKYLGQEGKNAIVKAAVSISAGYCGERGLNLIRKRTFYSKVLAGKWKVVIKKHEHLWKNHPAIDYSKIQKASSLEQIDLLLSTKILNYNTIEEYYAAHGSLEWLEHIKIPTLLLNALDDPIAHSQLVEAAKGKIGLNPNIILATTKKGGHMGWVQGGFFRPELKMWMDSVSLDFIRAAQKLQMTERGSETGLKCRGSLNKYSENNPFMKERDGFVAGTTMLERD